MPGNQVSINHLWKFSTLLNSVQPRNSELHTCSSQLTTVYLQMFQSYHGLEKKWPTTVLITIASPPTVMWAQLGCLVTSPYLQYYSVLCLSDCSLWHYFANFQKKKTHYIHWEAGFS